MTTIQPRALAKAIAHHEKVELLDLRSRQEFERLHIQGARSVPLPTLQPARLVRERGPMNPAPLYLVCVDRISASLAAGLLGGTGCLQPVVVEGGMPLWETQGLPVVHPVRRHVVTMVQQLGETIRQDTLHLRKSCRDGARRVQHALGRDPDNAWWCRYEFQPREAYRG